MEAVVDQLTGSVKEKYCFYQGTLADLSLVNHTFAEKIACPCVIFAFCVQVLMA